MAKQNFKNFTPHEPIFNKTSIGRRPSLQKMNKKKLKNAVKEAPSLALKSQVLPKDQHKSFF